VVICVERSANDLHMIQLMPLPPNHVLLCQNTDWINLSGAGLPRLFWRKETVKWVCVCAGVTEAGVLEEKVWD